jgi:hypothetical protein
MLKSSPLQAALLDEAWAVSGLFYGLEQLLDEDGRPLSERRAPSDVKKNVVMELRRCPYQDARNGKPMNVSALAQITKYLDAVLQDISAFRSTLAEEAQKGIAGSKEEGSEPLDALLVTVIDQLAGPALHVLARRRDDLRIPPLLSVGHKLAAGFFGVVYNLLFARAQGKERALDVDSMMHFIVESRALIGESEVCAGPPHLILRATEILLHGTAKERTSPLRIAFAKTLAAQVSLGIAWELFDAAVERRILLEDARRETLRPRTSTITRALDERVRELEKSGEPQTEAHAARAVPTSPASPAAIDPKDAESLRQLLASGGFALPAHAEIAEILHGLFSHGDSAIEIPDASLRLPLARRLAGFLVCYRRIVVTQVALELRLRELLQYSKEAPMKFGGVVFPHSKCQKWFEALTGHWVRCVAASNLEFRVMNHRRSVGLPAF